MRDHFRGPLSTHRHWESFLVTWAGAIANAFNGPLLPDAYFAEEHVEFDERFEVLIFSGVGDPTVVAAIELVSPANKDRPAERSAFVTKCASYLHQGVALIMVDVVTTRSANMHNELMRRTEAPAGALLDADSALYAAAYRPIRRDDSDLAEIWTEPLAIGDELPVLPLALNAACVLPLDLGATYDDACRRRRIG